MATKTLTRVQKQKATFEALKGDFGWTNPMQAPKVTKIIVATGVGSKSDKKKKEFIGERLTTLAGQKAVATLAKKSIATFKVREGDVVGHRVTLRGARMEAFLDKLVHIVLPRTRDFRGITPNAIDEIGNITVGIKEHTVFPEAAEEDIKDVFGLAVTIVTTAKNKAEAEAFLRSIGLPLQKEEAKK